MSTVEGAILRQRAIPVVRAADPGDAFALCERLVANHVISHQGAIVPV